MKRKRNSRLSKKKSLQRRRKNRRKVHTIENLEDRRMLAVAATWDAVVGKLEVTGTSDSDTIKIGSETLDNGDKVVTINGSTEIAGTTQISASLVKEVELKGGDGNDLIDVKDVKAEDFTQLSDGKVELKGGDGNDVLKGSEFGDKILGEAGNDSVVGGAGDDLLIGSTGNDFIQGGVGADNVIGGDGNDYLYGDGDEDQISGDAGNDILGGGLSADALSGGDGNDYFVGATGVDSIDGGNGIDSIELADDIQNVGFLGAWAAATGVGVNNQVSYASPGDGNHRASWIFSDLPVDAYEVFATWSDAPGTAATDAPFALLADGAERLVHVDQTSLPTGAQVAGQRWHSLGVVSVVDGTLDIELSNIADGVVIADAVRIVPQGQPTVGISAKGAGEARLSDQPISGANRATYYLDLDNSINQVDEWQIDWGDGTTDQVSGNATWTSHDYLEAGRFDIQVTATVGQVSHDLPTGDVLVRHAVAKNLLSNEQLADPNLPASDGIHEAVAGSWKLEFGEQLEVLRHADAEQPVFAFRNGGTTSITQEVDVIEGLEYYFAIDHRVFNSTGRASNGRLKVLDGHTGETLSITPFESSGDAQTTGVAFTATSSLARLIIEDDAVPSDGNEVDPSNPGTNTTGVDNPTLSEITYSTKENVEVIRDSILENSNTTVRRVRGSLAAVGQPINIGHGAIFTLEEDGTLNYDPVSAKSFFNLATDEIAYQNVLVQLDHGNGEYETKRLVIRIEGVNNGPTADQLIVKDGYFDEETPPTLLLRNAFDIDGYVSAVTFHEDSDNDGVLTAADRVIGIDNDHAGGWSVAVPPDDWGNGNRVFFAVPYDNSYSFSSPLTAGYAGAAKKLDLDYIGAVPIFENSVGVDLVSNGNFESPEISQSVAYRRLLSGWNVAAFGAPLEIRRETGALLDAGSNEDDQWVELDARYVSSRQPIEITTLGAFDEATPSSVSSGTAALNSQATIYQDIKVDPFFSHELTFSFAGNPVAGIDNELSVRVLEKDPLDESEFRVSTINNVYKLSDDGGSGLEWESRTISFIPQSDTIRLEFSDVGNPNQVGAFLDEVSLVRAANQDVDANLVVDATLLNQDFLLESLIENNRIPVQFTIDQPAAAPVTIIYRTVEGDAKPLWDYVPVYDARAVIPVGQTSTTAHITIIDDHLLEPTEEFFIDYRIDNGTLDTNLGEIAFGGSSNGGSITVRVEDQCGLPNVDCCDPDDDECTDDPPEDDRKPSVSVQGENAMEGDDAAATFRVSPAINADVVVEFTINGQLQAPILIPAATTSNRSSSLEYPVLLSGLDDNNVEDDFDYDFEITSARIDGGDADSVDIGSGSATVTINDDDTPTTFSISSISAPDDNGEGHVEGGNLARFKITAMPPQKPDGDPDSRPLPSDYELLSVDVTDQNGSNSRVQVTFPPNSLTTFLAVPTSDPSDASANVTATLVDPQSRDYEADGSATAHIEEDLPTKVDVAGLSIDEEPRTAEEIASGDPDDPQDPLQKLSAIITLSEPHHEAVSVGYTLNDQSAEQPADYFIFPNATSVSSGSKSIPAGTTEAKVWLYIEDDGLEEIVENFEIIISISDGLDGVELGNSSATITINDDGEDSNAEDGDRDKEENDECCACSCGSGNHADPQDGNVESNLKGPAGGSSHQTRRTTSRSGVTTDRITLPDNSAVPSAVELQITSPDGSQIYGTRFVSPDADEFLSGDAFSVSYDISSFDNLPTRTSPLFDYSVNRIFHYGEGDLATSTAEDPLKSQHTAFWTDTSAESHAGPGFGFDFIDQIVVEGSRAFLLQGDGEVLEYSRENGVYIGEDGVTSQIDNFLNWHVLGELHLPTGVNTPNNLMRDSSGIFHPAAYVRTSLNGNRDVFDVNGLHRVAIDIEGNVTRFSYDSVGRLAESTDYLGRTTAYSYDIDDDFRLDRITDWSGKIVDFTRTSLGAGKTKLRVSYVGDIDAETEREEFDFGANGNLLRYVGFGEETFYHYDDNGLLESMTDSDGNPTSVETMLSGSFVGDSAATLENAATLANPIRMSDPTMAGSVVTTTDALGNETTSRLNVFGDVVSMTDAAGHTVRYRYDADGRMTQMHEVDPRNPSETIDTAYEYDDRGNLLFIKHLTSSDPLGLTGDDVIKESFVYDEATNQVTEYTDESGRVTVHGLNDAGLVESTTRFPGAIIPGTGEFDWQNETNVIDVDNDGFVTPRDFDVLEMALNDKEDLDYINDLDGTLAPRTDNDLPYLDVETNEHPNKFVPLDALIYVNQQNTYTIKTRTEYTDESDLNSTDDSNRWKGLPAGMVKAQIDGDERRTEYRYYNDPSSLHSFGRLKSVVRPGISADRVSTTYYDLEGRVLLEQDAEGKLTGYRYDYFGRTTKSTLPFIIDGVHELAGLDLALASSVPLIESFINEDAAGSQYFYEEGNLAFTIDPTGLTTAFEYDSRLNLTSQTVGFGLDANLQQATSFVYDANNNLRVQIDAEGHHTFFNYDSMNRQIAVIGTHPDEGVYYPVWQNPIAPSDVNGDGEVNNDDRLHLETYLDGLGVLDTGQQPVPTDVSAGFNYYDVNGDGFFSPADKNAWGNAGLGHAGHAERPIQQAIYDNSGNVVAQIDAQGFVTQYRYDERHRQTHTILDNPANGSNIEGLDDIVFTSLPDPAIHRTTETVYDKSGYTAKVITRHGSTEYKYDNAGQLIEQRDPLAIDATSSSVTPQRPTTKFEYDRTGRTTRVIDPYDNSTTYEYYASTGELRKTIGHTPEAGKGAVQVTFAYDSLGRQMFTQDQSTGIYTTSRFDDYGRLESTSTTGGQDYKNVQVMTYDLVGNLVKRETSGAIGTFNDIGEFTGFAGNDEQLIAQYKYDELHRLQYIVEAAPDDLDGNEVTNLDTRTINNSLRSQRPITEFVYDSLNRQTTTINPEGLATTTTFDGLGRVERVTAPSGGYTEYEYDLRGHRLVERQTDGISLPAAGDPEFETTTYTYDGWNRLKTQRDGSARPVVYTYDHGSNSRTFTDADNNLWTWQYDSHGRVIEERIGESSTDAIPELTRSFGYDLVGNLVEKEDRNGRVISYEYDDAYRRTLERWYESNVDQTADHVIEFTYDTSGRMLNVKDDQHHYVYGYDGVSRIELFRAEIPGVTGVTGAASATFNYAYDHLGRRAELTMSTTHGMEPTIRYTNDYDYDAQNRLVGLTQAGDSVVTKMVEFDYYLDGRTEEITRSQLGFLNEIRSEFRDDSTSTNAGTGRVATISHQFVGDTTVTEQEYSYTYDLANRVTSFVFGTRNSDESINSYSYDDRSQLRNDGAEDYIYSHNGNIINSEVQTSFEGLYNRLPTDSEGRDLHYDYEGNLIARVDTNSFTLFNWDHRNRLTSVEEYNGNYNADLANGGGGSPQKTVSYTYDTYNQMISRTVDAEPTTYYLHEGGQIVAEFEQGTPAPIRYNLWGNSVDQLLAVDDVVENEVRWALSDRQGTIRDWVAINGDLLEHIAYDSFGNIPLVDDGEGNYVPNVTDGNGNLVNTGSRDTFFGYTGRLFDNDTGLQNNLNRWYDARDGRWISEDPIGFAAGDSNLYRYVGNSPTNWLDPNGLETQGLGLQHLTTPGAAPNIVSNGLKPGLDGGIWMSTNGGGASSSATVQMNFQVNLKVVNEIPDNVIRQAGKEANKALKGCGLKGAEYTSRWARLKGDFIANWAKKHGGEVFRMAAPGKHKGYHYFFTAKGFQSASPTLVSVTGAGSEGAVAAMAGANVADEALAAAGQAAQAKYGAGAKALKVGGRIMIVVGLASSGYEIYTADNRAKETCEQVGGWTGAASGAYAGGSAGSFFGPWGTAIGGIGGGIIGWFAGEKAGENIYEFGFEPGMLVE